MLTGKFSVRNNFCAEVLFSQHCNTLNGFSLLFGIGDEVIAIRYRQKPDVVA